MLDKSTYPVSVGSESPSIQENGPALRPCLILTDTAAAPRPEPRVCLSGLLACVAVSGLPRARQRPPLLLLSLADSTSLLRDSFLP